MNEREIHAATDADSEFLNHMLYLSALGNDDSVPRPEDSGYGDFWRLYETYRKELHSGEGETLIANVGGIPSGAAWYRYFRTQPGLAYINQDTPEITIAVAPEFQGRGIGRFLMEQLILTAREEGVPSLALNVEANNTPARNLYVSLGFTVFRTEEDGSLSMLLQLASNHE